jgi:hypothetical protein
MTTTILQSSWRRFFDAWRELNRIQFIAPWGRGARRR